MRGHGEAPETVMDNVVASFERCARLCREVQERATALENHPEQRRRLRGLPRP